jgi:hypothetical protein
MPNVTFNAITSGANFIAASVSVNFTNVSAIINNHGLDSDNYGASAILSQHVGPGAIISAHISNSQVVSQKISSSQLRHQHMNYQSSDGGVRLLRLGALANGQMIARISTALTQLSQTFAVAWSDAVDGNPGFTTTPVLLYTPAIQAANSVSFYTATNCYSINSSGATFAVSQTAAGTQSATVHLLAMGNT